jgi:hypothetical protein
MYFYIQQHNAKQKNRPNALEQCTKEHTENMKNVPKTMEQWNNGTMEQWNDGTMERWNDGTMERCKIMDTLSLRNRGLQVPNKQETMETMYQEDNGMMESGMMESGMMESMERWINGICRMMGQWGL